MSTVARKLPASTPRVTRSPIPERGQVIVIDGLQFEDGRQRVIVGYDVSPEHAAQLGERLEARDNEQDKFARLVETINSTIPAPATEGEGNHD